MIQMSSMLLNCAFYLKKVTSVCGRITRDICHLDITLKVISVIIADQCQSVLKQHGIDEQNSFLEKGMP